MAKKAAKKDEPTVRSLKKGTTTVVIDGLNPITQPPQDLSEVPGVLTMDDLEEMEEIRFVKDLLEFEDYASLLVQIQSYMQWAANVGRNDKLIGLEDFELAIINTRDDGMNPGFVDAGAQLVARSKDTGNYAPFDLVPPRGFPQDSNARNTALALIGLAS